MNLRNSESNSNTIFSCKDRKAKNPFSKITEDAL